MCFGKGLKWRCIGPSWYCEVQNEGNAPVFNDSSLAAKIRQVRNFYAARLTNLGLMDAGGYGLDVLVANAFTESSGVVPSPLDTGPLEKVFDGAPGDIAAKADLTARYVKTNARGLVAFEPGYINPVSTPGRISMGAHQQLISTAGWLRGFPGKLTDAQLRELVTKLPSDSKYAAQLAVTYFNNYHSKHLNQPPLMAACYNAGSLRESAQNAWDLVSTSNHIDRWVKHFNMSRMAVTGGGPAAKPAGTTAKPAGTSGVIPPMSPRNVNGSDKFSVESVMAALQRKGYAIKTSDEKNYNLNLVGIRNDKARVNYFDDFLFVFWKFGGAWLTRTYPITTYPGIVYLADHLVNRKGTAILKEGHYPNSHRVGMHHRNKPTGYEALIQVGDLTVYRDKTLDGKIDLDPSTLDTGDDFAVNIHHAKPGGLTTNVGPFSAGCQVFADFQQWTEFHDLFKQAQSNWGSTFTYTLINLKDL